MQFVFAITVKKSLCPSKRKINKIMIIKPNQIKSKLKGAGHHCEVGIPPPPPILRPRSDSLVSYCVDQKK